MKTQVASNNLTFVSFKPSDRPNILRQAVTLINDTAASAEDGHKLFRADPNLLHDISARCTVALDNVVVVGVVITTVNSKGERWANSLAVRRTHRGARLAQPLVHHALADRFAVEGRTCEVFAYVRVLEDGIPNPASARTLVHNGFTLREVHHVNVAAFGDRVRSWVNTTWADLALFHRPDGLPLSTIEGGVT